MGKFLGDEEEEARRCLHPGYPRCEIVPGLFKGGYSLVASCVDGGLLLLERFMHGDVSLYLVCNPVSRQWVIVPLHSRRMTRPLRPVRPPAVRRAQAASTHQRRRVLRLGQVGVALRPLARGC